MTGDAKSAEGTEAGIAGSLPAVQEGEGVGRVRGGEGAGAGPGAAVGIPGMAAGDAIIGQNGLSRSDLRTLEKAIYGGVKRKRMPIGEEEAVLAVTVVRLAMQQQGGSHRVRLRAAKIVTDMAKINQADDHLEAKWGRIDSGKPTDSSEVKMGVSVEFLEPGAGPKQT